MFTNIEFLSTFLAILLLTTDNIEYSQNSKIKLKEAILKNTNNSEAQDWVGTLTFQEYK